MLKTLLALFYVGAGCGECSSNSVVADFPVGGELNKNTSVKNGGINAVAFLKCNATLNDETQLADWNAAIAASELIVRTDCAFEADLASASTTIDVGACLRTVVTRRRSTITITDIADNANFDVHKFYNYLQENPNSLKIAFFTCDGEVYGFRDADIDANFNIANNKDGRKTWNAVITFDEEVQAPPIAPAAGATISLAGLTLAPTCALLGVALAGIPVADGSTVALGTIAAGTTLDLDLVNSSKINVLTITSVASDNADAVVTFSTPTTAPIGGGIASGEIEFNGAAGAHSAVITIVSNDCTTASRTFTVTWTI